MTHLMGDDMLPIDFIIVGTIPDRFKVYHGYVIVGFDSLSKKSSCVISKISCSIHCIICSSELIRIIEA
jgi:hypothetical protein